MYMNAFYLLTLVHKNTFVKSCRAIPLMATNLTFDPPCQGPTGLLLLKAGFMKPCPVISLVRTDLTPSIKAILGYTPISKTSVSL